MPLREDVSMPDAILARTFPDPGPAWDDLVALCRTAPEGRPAPVIHVETDLDFSLSSGPEVVDTLAGSPLRAQLFVIADIHSLGSSPPTVLMCTPTREHKAFRCEALHVSRVVSEIAADPAVHTALARQFDVRGNYNGPPIPSLTPPRQQRRPTWRRFLSSRAGRDRGDVAAWPTGPLVDPFALAELEAACIKPREEQPVVLHLHPQAWKAAEAIVRREHAVTSAGEALMEVCGSRHNHWVDPRRDRKEGTAAFEIGLTTGDLQQLETEVESQELDSVSQYVRLEIASFVARFG